MRLGSNNINKQRPAKRLQTNPLWRGNWTRTPDKDGASQFLGEMMKMEDDALLAEIEAEADAESRRQVMLQSVDAKQRVELPRGPCTDAIPVMLQSVDARQRARLEELFALQRIAATHRIMTITEQHSEVLAKRSAQLETSSLEVEKHQRKKVHRDVSAASVGSSFSPTSSPATRSLTSDSTMMGGRRSFNGTADGGRQRAATALHVDARRLAVEREIHKAHEEDEVRLMLFAAKIAVKGQRNKGAPGYFPSQALLTRPWSNRQILPSPFGQAQPFRADPDGRRRASSALGTRGARDARGKGAKGGGACGQSSDAWTPFSTPGSASLPGGANARSDEKREIEVWKTSAQAGSLHAPEVLTIYHPSSGEEADAPHGTGQLEQGVGWHPTPHEEAAAPDDEGAGASSASESRPRTSLNSRPATSSSGATIASANTRPHTSEPHASEGVSGRHARAHRSAAFKEWGQEAPPGSYRSPAARSQRSQRSSGSPRSQQSTAPPVSALSAPGGLQPRLGSSRSFRGVEGTPRRFFSPSRSSAATAGYWEGVSQDVVQMAAPGRRMQMDDELATDARMLRFQLATDARMFRFQASNLILQLDEFPPGALSPPPLSPYVKHTSSWEDRTEEADAAPSIARAGTPVGGHQSPARGGTPVEGHQEQEASGASEAGQGGEQEAFGASGESEAGQGVVPAGREGK
ncbi:hypothetical protein T484DRAFT_1779371, partial [Baffinella frigidus]